MKKLIYTLVILAFVSSVSAQWVSFNPSGTGDMNDVYFNDANTGYAVGEGNGKGIIIKTTNGGTTWSNVYMTTTNSLWIKSIHFVNANTGFACGNGGFVYSTTNAGLNWTSQNLTDVELECIRFVNTTTGLTCGDNNASTNRGPTFKTTNAGATWTKVNNSVAHMDFIQYIDVNTVYASGDYVIYKSTNGGDTWTDIYPGNRDCNWVYFLNTNTGFACGNYTMLKTTDAGANWTEFLVSPTDTNYHSSVIFTDANTGYISLIKIPTYAPGRIYKTTTGGSIWHLQQTFTNAYFGAIKFLNLNTGFAVGGGGPGAGGIYKTTNGGGTISVNNISTEVPSQYSLSQNYPNPFNPTTKIKFDVVLDSRFRGNDKVVLVMYDVMGREVQTLVNESLKPGTYEILFDGSQLTSGVYFYKLITGGFSATKKLILLK